ncbi:hypothetical protein V6Z12_D10G141300 [Gossypium hirsutum]
MHIFTKTYHVDHLTKHTIWYQNSNLKLASNDHVNHLHQSINLPQFHPITKNIFNMYNHVIIFIFHNSTILSYSSIIRGQIFTYHILDLFYYQNVKTQAKQMAKISTKHID